jgi:hypothetical protein
MCIYAFMKNKANQKASTETLHHLLNVAITYTKVGKKER